MIKSPPENKGTFIHLIKLVLLIYRVEIEYAYMRKLSATTDRRSCSDIIIIKVRLRD